MHRERAARRRGVLLHSFLDLGKMLGSFDVFVEAVLLRFSPLDFCPEKFSAAVEPDLKRILRLRVFAELITAASPRSRRSLPERAGRVSHASRCHR